MHCAIKKNLIKTEHSLRPALKTIHKHNNHTAVILLLLLLTRQLWCHFAEHCSKFFERERSCISTFTSSMIRFLVDVTCSSDYYFRVQGYQSRSTLTPHALLAESENCFIAGEFQPPNGWNPLKLGL
jgi:hypothetical protein